MSFNTITLATAVDKRLHGQTVTWFVKYFGNFTFILPLFFLDFCIACRWDLVNPRRVNSILLVLSHLRLTIRHPLLSTNTSTNHNAAFGRPCRQKIKQICLFSADKIGR